MANSLVVRALGVWDALTARLRGAGEHVALAAMRIVMGWEFWESGIEKFNGENWFADIQDRFPTPFNIIPADLSWSIATWFEIIGGVALWLGFGTRFFAFSLLFLTFVATAAVHWPDMVSMWSDLLKGYAISDMGHGNFKLPLLFSIMLLPLVFSGAGKFSVDHVLSRFVGIDGDARPIEDAYAWSLAALVLGIPMLMLLPALGFAIIGAGVAIALFGRYARA